MTSSARNISIWVWAFGYFAAYVPYAALTKALTKGLGPAAGAPVDGVGMLPVATGASAVASLAFLFASGWWRAARRAGGIPVPGLWTGLSGLATATILLTTTFAYTIPGASIVLMMVLMRGGVLCIAPVIDFVSGRRVAWYSWAALAMSVTALGIVTESTDSAALPFAALVDVGLYLAGYVARLRTMTRLAKASAEDNRRYFVEEQLVASPAALLFLALMAAFVPGGLAEGIRAGFSPGAIWPWIVLVGLCSQGTGIFGGLILLDPRENSFCVPVNRASSMVAGVVGSFALALLFGQGTPPTRELIGAGLMIAATVVLAVGPKLGRARRVAAA